jgi:amino acid transporter
MERLKKIVLMISGPVVLGVVLIALFIQIFTLTNARPVIIGGLIVFFIVFIPLYAFEYFRQEFKNEKRKKDIRFKRNNKRTEWEGGNIHGKVPKEVDRPGKLFNNK